MAIAIMVLDDPFARGIVKLKNSYNAQIAKDEKAPTALRNRIARRPMRGVQVKDDTYATFMLADRNGDLHDLINEAAPSKGEEDRIIGTSPYNTNFILQSVTESRMEKMQIIETFGEPYIAFFGERPRFVDAAGVLMNTEDFDWRTEFWENYDKHLRGTKLVEKGYRIWLSYDDLLLEGYLLQATASQTAGEPHTINFNFRMFLTRYIPLNIPGNVEIPPGKMADRWKISDIPPLHELLEQRAKKQGYSDITGLLNHVNRAKSYGTGTYLKMQMGFPAGGGVGAWANSDLVQNALSMVTLNKGQFVYTPRKQLRTRKSDNFDEYPNSLWENLDWATTREIEDIGGISGQAALLGAVGLTPEGANQLINSAMNMIKPDRGQAAPGNVEEVSLTPATPKIININATDFADGIELEEEEEPSHMNYILTEDNRIAEDLQDRLFTDPIVESTHDVNNKVKLRTGDMTA